MEWEGWSEVGRREEIGFVVYFHGAVGCVTILRRVWHGGGRGSGGRGKTRSREWATDARRGVRVEGRGGVGLWRRGEGKRGIFALACEGEAC